jgi:hypothetical protein
MHLRYCFIHVGTEVNRFAEKCGWSLFWNYLLPKKTGEVMSKCKSNAKSESQK